MANVGLIGCGYWGKNYVKTIKEINGMDLKWIYNKNKDVSKENIPKGAKFTKNYKEILFDKEVDAVIIATPPKTHYEIAKHALKFGKDVLIEKPITCNSKKALELVLLADQKSRILMTGHIFLYNSSIQILKESIDKNEFGNIFSFYSRRTGLGPVREDVSAMWNLAPHDISIMNFLIDDVPKTISANGSSFLKKGIEDVVDLSLEYKNGIYGSIHVSWIEPNKIRETIIVGDKKIAIFDDTSENKLKIFNKTKDNFNEEVIKSEFPDKSPLTNQCSHFLNCIQTRKNPLTDGYNGYIVTKILESAQESLKSGEKIDIM